MVARPDLTEARSATLVAAARTIVDDLVRIPHLRAVSGLAAELESAAMAIVA